jgi:hypothetical protein
MTKVSAAESLERLNPAGPLGLFEIDMKAHCALFSAIEVTPAKP